MKEFLAALKKDRLIKEIDNPLSVDLEIPAVLLGLDRQALLFKKPKESKIPLAGNLYSTRERLELGIAKTKTERLSEVVLGAINSPSEIMGQIAGFSSKNFDFNEDADLTKLPILKHFQKEAGRYLTAGIVIAKFPGSDEMNLSFHRMLVLQKDKVTARIVPRHLAQIAKEKGKVPIALVIGPPPAVFLAASLQVGYGLSEYRIANKLMNGGLKLMSTERGDLAFPLDSEIVLEGELDWKELVPEGPFVDLTGTYDEVREQPVITFTKMHYRIDSVYQAVVASSPEHSLFMGLPQELKIREALSRSIPKVRGVNLTDGGSGYFHCVVSLEKSNDGDGKTAILNCFAASHPLKLVIAVDYDIDPFDLRAVEWALATRFQADRGTIIVKGARGSSLDPSSGKSAVTSKLGLDATLPIAQRSGELAKFERAAPMESPATRSVIQALLKSKGTYASDSE